MNVTMMKTRKRFVAMLGVAGTVALLPVGASAASGSKTLSSNTKFFVRVPDPAAVTQIEQLALHGDIADAVRMANMGVIPQAVWLDGGTPAAVTRLVETTLLEAELEHTVPVFVPYNIPGRDCGGYSAGGAQTTAAYETWISAIASTIGTHQVVVVLEPDALANLPSDCGYDPTGTLTTARFAQINYAIGALEANPSTLVYLDAGHSEWQSVGTISQRLVQAGVGQTQGFFLNVSNYQPTPQLTEYGTWIAECIYFAAQPDWRLGNYDYCASQYYPANSTDFSTWSQSDAWYTANVWQQANPPASLSVLTHFILDTSRNGTSTGDNPPSYKMNVYGSAPYNEEASVISTLQAGSWCNPPTSGLGARPTANTGNANVDAFLWVKTPGESDGECDIQGGVRAWDYSVYTQPGWPTVADQTAADAAYETFDPLWGLTDPAAGIWFPQQALQLAQLASPALL
jgi:endoglucanase